MAFQVSRVVMVTDIDPETLLLIEKKAFMGDFGGPYPTREQAEKKLAETQNSVFRLYKPGVHASFEIREVEETPAMRESWIRKGLVPKPESQPQSTEASLVNRLAPNANKFLPPPQHPVDGDIEDKPTVDGLADGPARDHRAGTDFWANRPRQSGEAELIDQALRDHKDAGVEPAD